MRNKTTTTNGNIHHITKPDLVWGHIKLKGGKKDE